ncbi:FAS1-like dehydratase domain-containing protein [Hyphomonas chukchiensis]|uniref:FAS1-like dehydratase domain-containing protein n=1 Tax=Hyphomonas chukchiensis TaxID=1280947 RepID=UPI0030F8DB08
MTTGTDTLIVPELREAKGRWGKTRYSPPVSSSDIRKWVIATYWPETPPPIYWDEAYAATTRWGGIIAPPDFNPFAWPVHRPDFTALPGPKGVRLTSLNGGQLETYGVPQRPGDVIAERERIESFKERQGRFGLMLYLDVETEWVNQSADLVRRRISTYIRY